MFSLLYPRLRVLRAGGREALGEVKHWFPALLFRDQKMVLWLSYGPTICDMLTA